MKIETEQQEFRPRKITLTIESLDDVRVLWAMSNVAWCVLVNNGGTVGLKDISPCGGEAQTLLFRAVNEIAKKEGLR